jgi:DNA-binding transcriptional ArsR family regulator
VNIRGGGHDNRATRTYHRCVPMTSDVASDELAPAIALFRSLADPSRLVILRRLARGEARVVELTKECGLAQSTVSEHLACLRECGLVGSRAVGRTSVHYLTQPALFTLLAAAETLLAATGEAVVICPSYRADQ